MKKILFTVISVILSVALLTLCGCGTTETEETPTPPVVKFEGDMANLAAVAGDYHITLDEVNVFIGALVPYIQQSTGADEGWEEILGSDGLTARDSLIQYAIEEARYQHVFLEMAKSDGYFTTEDEEDFYNKYVESVGGEEAYNDFLEEYKFTDEAFRKYINATGAYTKVSESMCTDEEAVEIYNKDFLTAKHILVLFENRESEEATFEEAKAIYERAIAGENFEKLIEAYNEDPGSKDPESSYTFGEGEMVDEFYKGTLNLEIGEISEPIKTVYGYHIIKRYDNPGTESPDYMNYINQIKANKSSEYVSETKMNALLEEYPLTINESILSQIDLSMYTITE